MNYFTESDMIFNKHNGALGFDVNSILLKSDNNPINDIKQKGGSFNHLLNDLAVPAGLLFLQQTINNVNYNHNDNYINDSLYNKLINFSEFKSKKNTRKNVKTNKNKTKKK